ncbi:MAG: sodium-dependent transporter [Planctomycetota bacterium]
MSESRGSWGSKLGFILAASGSAIGLGNIVFFSGNAYKYGGGAFYVPYLIALFLIGIPVMILELGVGRMTRSSMPNAMYKLTGVRGELAGWFGVLNASIITMYYIAILAWVMGMWVGSLGELWQSAEVANFGLPEGALSNSMSYFFNMISGVHPLFYVVIVWIMNVLIILKGTRTIEPVVKVFVPLMWLMMIVLIVRGITLENGLQGIFFLFTPDFSIMSDHEVWKGAFSQMFFTLSLGFGIMTAYASYLPKKSDDVQNATTISLMNCGFEYIAGLAIFSLLFAFAIVPKTSTISMMFFVVPEGIARFPMLVDTFGLLFFTLLLMAGLTSSVSLVEAVVLSIIDKFRLPRMKVIAVVFIVGLAGSLMFALPEVVDKGLENDGTLGFTLLDLFDHWAFGYGLLLCGLLEVIILGWLYDIDKLLAFINESARFKLGWKFKGLVRFILPAVIITILGFCVNGEIKDGLYGCRFFKEGSYEYLYCFVFFGWIAFSVGGTLIFTALRRRNRSEDLT